MKFFYISTVSNSDSSYEIHHRDCPYLPDPDKREYIGPFNTGKEALRKAIHANPNACLCPFCCVKDGTIKLKRSNQSDL
jgi:hypothetical protein